jgi:AraC family transcriptional regulator
MTNTLSDWHQNRCLEFVESYHKGQYSGTITAVRDCEGILSSITVYDQNDFNDRLHCHENTHISLVIRGGCREKKKDCYERLPGTLTFYHAGEPHQFLQFGQSSKHLNLEIEQQFLKRYQLNEQMLSKALTKTADGKFVLLKMHRELLAADAGSDVSIRMLLLGSMTSADKCSSEKPLWIQRIHEMLRDVWQDNPSLELLSTVSGVHPVTVSKYFHKHYGCTLGDYLRKLKVEKALTQVSQGKHTLSEVAYHCGFADQSHFTRNFKYYTGFMPSEFRRL